MATALLAMSRSPANGSRRRRRWAIRKPSRICGKCGDEDNARHVRRSRRWCDIDSFGEVKPDRERRNMTDMMLGIAMGEYQAIESRLTAYKAEPQSGIMDRPGS